MIEMQLARILIRETDDMHVVELRERHPESDQPRIFPIVIGYTEANAIERRLMGHVPPRPQTHELLATVINELGYRLERIVINDLNEHTFFARIHLANGEHTIDIDARPSDAIALGAAEETPIFVEEKVLADVAPPLDEDGDAFYDPTDD